jgi:hypothetical protein
VPQSSAIPIASLYCNTSVDGLADFTVDTNDGATTTEANFGSELVGHVMLGQRNTDVPGTATSVAADADEQTTTTVSTTASAALLATRERAPVDPIEYPPWRLGLNGLVTEGPFAAQCGFHIPSVGNVPAFLITTLREMSNRLSRADRGPQLDRGQSGPRERAPALVAMRFCLTIFRES